MKPLCSHTPAIPAPHPKRAPPHTRHPTIPHRLHPGSGFKLALDSVRIASAIAVAEFTDAFKQLQAKSHITPLFNADLLVSDLVGSRAVCSGFGQGEAHRCWVCASRICVARGVMWFG